MRNHFLHALILFCGNTATEMTNPLASIGAMGYHFGNTVNKEDLRIVIFLRCPNGKISTRSLWLYRNIMMPGSKGLSPHELVHRWVKDLVTRPDRSIKVG